MSQLDTVSSKGVGGDLSGYRRRRVNWMGLAAQAQGDEHCVVALDAFALQVIEELAAAAGHREKTTAAVEVLAMAAQVFREVDDASGEQRDLNLG